MNSCDRPSFSAGCFARSDSAADAERLRALLAHRQRVAVVEAERHRGAESQRRERAVQRLQPGAAFELEDLLGDGAGVFGIQVDRAGLERRVEDAGIAEAGPVHRVAGGAHDDLAQDVGLGKALGADLEGFSLRGEKKCREKKQKPFHAARSSFFAPASRNCSAARLAYRPPCLHEFGVRALRDDPAAVHHHDAVGVLHGGEAVRDHQRWCGRARAPPAPAAPCARSPHRASWSPRRAAGSAGRRAARARSTGAGAGRPRA